MEKEQVYLYVPTLNHCKWVGKGKKRKFEPTGLTTQFAAFRSCEDAELIARLMNDWLCDKGYMDVDAIELVELKGGEDDA